ncbi:MAG: hypothetical protein JWQ79_3199 [Mucilaginibacter sp.]|nr:hypothetical protein [Mucilaginibacter sp.]
MDKLKIAKFKAFEDEIIIPLENKKNLLLYGENGAGKSSIYQALKIVFYKNKIDLHLTASTPEDLEQLRNEFWSSYNNKKANSNFEIQVNDTDYLSFNIASYQTFMISSEELVIGDKINLRELLSGFLFAISDIHSFCNTHYNQIQESVNHALSDFKENVKIEIDEEDDFTIKILDPIKNIERKSDFKKYFNEAKLNLIIILISLNAIEISKDQSKSKILVLDDFITSLDSSNRIFIIKYIFEKFQDTQVLIFTHNISFYNLIMYIVNDIDSTSTRWAFSNLFEINNYHKIYIKSGIEKVQLIKNDFDGLTATNVEIEMIGNRIRKKFEILLYEYSKLLMIGTVEDSKKILDRITLGKPCYYTNHKTASDLIDIIEQILLENNQNNLTGRLQDKINSFKNAEFGNFQKILKELKLYQKVTMHPMSHGIIGMPTFTIKEIEIAIDLLEKMEKFLKDMVDSNVAVV